MQNESEFWYDISTEIIERLYESKRPVYTDQQLDALEKSWKSFCEFFQVDSYLFDISVSEDNEKDLVLYFNNDKVVMDILIKEDGSVDAILKSDVGRKVNVSCKKHDLVLKSLEELLIMIKTEDILLLHPGDC